MTKLLGLFCVVIAVCLMGTIANSTEPNNNAVTTTNTTATTAKVHCEVPCGIYADQRRFEEMLEDTQTIAKSIASIEEITKGFESGPTPKGVNQLTRWVNTKEAHATNTQQIVAQYFLTQRIKADKENYVDQLKAAHAVMVAAMKCKQDAKAETAANLKLAIGKLYRAYEGKDPEFEKDHK
ncbi:MAG: superoxide dismutase [Ni] [Mariniblastus sp.]